jgi:hypothetical protein
MVCGQTTRLVFRDGDQSPLAHTEIVYRKGIFRALFWWVFGAWFWVIGGWEKLAVIALPILTSDNHALFNP